MKALVKELLHLTEVRQLTEDVRGGVSPVLVTGVGPVHRAQVEAALHRDSGRPLWVLCADEREARRQAGDLAVLTGETPLVLPARELQWRPMESSRQWENQRLAALYRLADSPVVVTTPDALVQRCIPPRVLERTALTLAVGQQWDLNALTRRLAGAGYTRCDQVEGPGQFALRGGILDVFSPGMEQPVRCEFFDDEIDSLGIFDAATQRRVENRREALLLPAAEVLPGWEEHTAEDAAARLEAAVKRLARRQGTQALRDLLTADAALLRQGVTPNGADRCMAAVYPEKTTALDYLPADALICVEDSGRTAEALRGWLWQLKEDVSAGMEAGFLAGELADFAASEPELALGLEKHPVVQLDGLTTGRQLLQPRDLLQLTAKQLSSYGGSLELACTDLTHYLTSGYRVMVLCGGEVRARNLRRMLADRKIPAAVDLSGEKSPEKGTVLIAVGALSAGCEYPEGRLAVLTEGQLTTPLSGRAKKPRPRRDSNQQKLQSYTDLTPGDLVVHAHHGIGRFVAMLRMPVDGVEKDYIKIAYAGQDVLYVPATSLDLVSKYIGPGEDNERTKLNKLGGTEWAKTTRKAKAAAKDLAEGLIRLYAQRQRLAGHAFSPDSPWQQEFEDAFPYTETDDQLQAIRDIKADMEQPRPMDRLLCGDVGYGKTEVALRAVMKCILDGKQAAILVPTTVLAQQHYATAVNRFRSFPVNIEVLSRFRTPAQVRDILARTQAGKVDLLIGTHKLLQKDLQFHDLGLLVIDEEQRFGVTHKEKLRERARQVDTLTLSATPIPRTLNMALSGIRDMSTIEEPPHDRQPVQTYVMEHEWPVIAEGGCGHRHCPRQNGRAGAELRHAADGRRRDPGAGVHHHHRDRHRYPQRQHPDHRGRGPAGPVPAAPDPGPHRPQRPPGVCLSDLSPRQGADGGGRQAPVRHPGVCGLRLRLPHCHAGPGDPRGGEPAGPGAVRLSDECGLRHVSAAAERRGAGAAGEGKGHPPRLLGGPGHLRPHSGAVCALRPPAHGPVPPHGGHPHHGGGVGPGGRADGPLRRPAQAGDGPAGRGPAAGCRRRGVHHRYHPEGRCGGLHL